MTEVASLPRVPRGNYALNGDRLFFKMSKRRFTLGPDL
jgi:hypothetical protein